MSKSWLETEDGRTALEAVRDHQESIQFFNEAGKVQIALMSERLLGLAVNDPAKDREFIVAKAELDGAIRMLRSIKQLLDKQAPPKRKS